MLSRVLDINTKSATRCGYLFSTNDILTFKLIAALSASVLSSKNEYSGPPSAAHDRFTTQLLR
jgi:hypothetical protein